MSGITPSKQTPPYLITLWDLSKQTRLKDCFHPKIYFTFFFFFGFGGPHLQHMEIPRLGGESELQEPAYTTAIARQEPSHICDLHLSNTGSLTHWSMSGIKPASSWILVGCVSAVPQRELPIPHFETPEIAPGPMIHQWTERQKIPVCLRS